jgi:hypothetical protein
MARPRRGGRRTPPAPRERAARWRRPLARGRFWSAFPAWLVAATGIAGLLFTLRPAPTVPPTREPVRFSSGPSLTARLVVILVPQLDERGLATLRGALGTLGATPGAAATVTRPGFASFDEATLQLFAGNVAGGAVPPVASESGGGLSDTVVRSVAGQERGAALIGPPDWQALFGVAPAPTPTPSPSQSVAPAGSAALIAAARATLAARQTTLVLVQLRELVARDIRPDGGALIGPLGDLAALLDARDSLVIVGGGGGNGEPLRLHLAGAGIGVTQGRGLALNDFAPTVAVLLGTPYPSEVRGRIAWPLLAADTQRKAEATVGLARQRAGLVVSTLPLGRPYPVELLAVQAQLPTLDATLAGGQTAYAYQLASSAVDQADRLLLTAAEVTPLPVSPRAAPWLMAACLGGALYTLLVAGLARAWLSLGAAAAGGAIALALWLAIDIYLQRLVVPRLWVVIGLMALLALCGGGVGTWLTRFLRGQARGGWARTSWRAVEFLALLAVVPAAFCAYRYGFPWRLRLEETAPLFRWRAALLAPAALLIAGSFWTLLLARLDRRRRPASGGGR